MKEIKKKDISEQISSDRNDLETINKISKKLKRKSKTRNKI